MFFTLIFSVFLFQYGVRALPSNLKGTTGKILVSGYSAEIGVFSLDGDALTRTGTWSVDPNLTWLQQSGDSFYAIHEVGDYNGQPGGAISRWQVENDQLVRREALSLLSPGPAHVLVDTDHGLAYTANYGGGSVTVVAMTDGFLTEVVQLLEYGDGCRDASHPHEIVRSGDIVWVVDLGCDSIYTYKVENGQLAHQGTTSVTAGYGPRHMTLTGNMAVLACELQNYVLTFEVGEDGTLTQMQELQYASANGNKGAEILVHNGYVYASSRGEGVVVVYSISDNQLTRIQELKLDGTWPRSIDIKDDIMVAANKEGDSVQVVNIDSSTGMLTTGGVVETPQYPAFVMFFD